MWFVCGRSFFACHWYEFAVFFESPPARCPLVRLRCRWWSVWWACRWCARGAGWWLLERSSVPGWWGWGCPRGEPMLRQQSRGRFPSWPWGWPAGWWRLVRQGRCSAGGLRGGGWWWSSLPGRWGWAPWGAHAVRPCRGWAGVALAGALLVPLVPSGAAGGSLLWGVLGLWWVVALRGGPRQHGRRGALCGLLWACWGWGVRVLSTKSNGLPRQEGRCCPSTLFGKPRYGTGTVSGHRCSQCTSRLGLPSWSGRKRRKSLRGAALDYTAFLIQVSRSA